MKPHRTNQERNLPARVATCLADVRGLFNEAVSFHQRGELVSAKIGYAKVLAIDSRHFDSLHLIGVLEVQLGEFDQGLFHIDQAIAINPNYAVAFSNRGSALKGLQRLDEAVESYDRAIQLKPDYKEVYNSRGLVLYELQRYGDAKASFTAAISVDPFDAQTYNNRGIALQTMARKDIEEDGGAVLLDQAMCDFDKALELQPGYAEAHNNRGNILRSQKKYALAIECYDQALVLNPDYGEAFSNRGNALCDALRFQEALASYDRAIELNPRYVEAFSNRGSALTKMGEYFAAIESFDQAIAVNSGSAHTYNKRGDTYARLKKHYAAIDDYDRAIKIDPGFAEAYNNCGNVFRELRQFAVALAHYEKAIDLQPDFAVAYANRAVVSKEVGQMDFVIESYDQALKLEPDNAYWWFQRGQALVAQRKHFEGIQSFEQAYALDPTQDFLFGTLVHQKSYISDWISVESDSCEVELRVRDRKKCVVPFAILSMTGSGQLQLQCAQTWVITQVPETELLGPFQPRARRKKIRIGYFSADFRNHPVSYLTAELFELHNRSAFEVIGFSFGTTIEDEMKLRLRKAFDQFIEVDSKTDQEIAMLARTMEIDIAVDLNGFTGGSRTGIFAMRAAPIQINYLGYPGSMGAKYIDYIIADVTTIPMACQNFYEEKIIYLPSFQVNDSTRLISSTNYTRIELGLPETGFVFCCFNSIYKVNPAVFDGWVRIMNRVPGSVMFMLGANEISMENLHKEAEKRGLRRHRIVFGKHIQLSEHLSRYKVANLFLDTQPFNAGTTASDALWAELPVITRTGETFASRMAASLLIALELPELVTSSQQDYEDLAVELASNTEKYDRIMSKLKKNRLTTRLFDTKRFTKNIEASYAEVFEGLINGLPAKNIIVSD